ncbi:hypothetical protein L3V83_07375 [Thiotrichales bacterium 19X7-9]|nr:hypothetical protein [Thiotrichales bacterium 19X7-9]
MLTIKPFFDSVSLHAKHFREDADENLAPSYVSRNQYEVANELLNSPDESDIYLKAKHLKVFNKDTLSEFLIEKLLEKPNTAITLTMFGHRLAVGYDGNSFHIIDHDKVTSASSINELLPKIMHSMQQQNGLIYVCVDEYTAQPYGKVQQMFDHVSISDLEKKSIDKKRPMLISLALQNNVIEAVKHYFTILEYSDKDKTYIKNHILMNLTSSGIFYNNESSKQTLEALLLGVKSLNFDDQDLVDILNHINIEYILDYAFEHGSERDINFIFDTLSKLNLSISVLDQINLQSPAIKENIQGYFGNIC